MPIQGLVKFFSQVGEAWQIAQEIRAMVQFRPLNLLNDFTSLGTFDLVFCRNVLIYFDQDAKIGVLDRIARQMPADGYLVLGAAETVVGLTEAFKPMADQRGLYMPNTAAARCAGRNVLKFAAKVFFPLPLWERVPSERSERGGDRTIAAVSALTACASHTDNLTKPDSNIMLRASCAGAITSGFTWPSSPLKDIPTTGVSRRSPIKSPAGAGHVGRVEVLVF